MQRQDVQLERTSTGNENNMCRYILSFDDTLSYLKWVWYPCACVDARSWFSTVILKFATILMFCSKPFVGSIFNPTRRVAKVDGQVFVGTFPLPVGSSPLRLSGGYDTAVAVL